MPKTRSQKRAASQVEASPVQPVPAKRARQRSTTATNTITGRNTNEGVRDAKYGNSSGLDLAPRRKGKESERTTLVPASLSKPSSSSSTALKPQRRADRCHIYLAGPEDFRMGLNEQENEQLEVAAEELLVQGKKLAHIEMQDLRRKAGSERNGARPMDGNRREDESMSWTESYWRPMEMPEYRTIGESRISSCETQVSRVD
jgi:hypothetical protein